MPTYGKTNIDIKTTFGFYAREKLKGGESEKDFGYFGGFISRLFNFCN